MQNGMTHMRGYSCGANLLIMYGGGVGADTVTFANIEYEMIYHLRGMAGWW